MTKSRVMVWLLIALGVVSGVAAAIMLVGAQIGSIPLAAFECVDLGVNFDRRRGQESLEAASSCERGCVCKDCRGASARPHGENPHLRPSRPAQHRLRACLRLVGSGGIASQLTKRARCPLRAEKTSVRAPAVQGFRSRRRRRGRPEVIMGLIDACSILAEGRPGLRTQSVEITNLVGTNRYGLGLHWRAHGNY